MKFYNTKMRIPVVDKDHHPLMPTTPARARKWVESGKVVKHWSDCGHFYVQLVAEPSGRATQDIAIGIDPGKKYSGIGVVSAKFTKKMGLKPRPSRTAFL